MNLITIKHRLEILALIGQGGQAKVFLARLPFHPSRALVSLKAFASQIVCEREGKLLAQLSHPLIARFYGITSGEYSGLVGEYVCGPNLAILLDMWAKNSVGLSNLEVLFLAHELLDALIYLESKKIVHGDLAAENILVSSEASIKLCDFGSGSWAEEASANRAVFGRRDFLAPEILAGEAPTRWSDLYSLGSVLFEIVTKERYCPSNAELSRFRLRSRLSTELPTLYYVISSCLESSPWRRPSCAGVAKSRLSAMSERQIVIAKQELSSKMPHFNLPRALSPGIFVDFFPTAYFGCVGN